MNKKYILLLVGIIVLFLVYIGYIALLQKPNNTVTPSAKVNTSQTVNQSHANSQTAVTFAPLSGSPKEAARQFYMYYIATLTNPLANGAYKTNPYLSQDFKDLLNSSYDNGNKPPFCPQNKRTNIVVGKEAQVYANNQYMTDETISEAPPGTKDLYTILLENNNGTWLVEDVNCIY